MNRGQSFPLSIGCALAALLSIALPGRAQTADTAAPAPDAALSAEQLDQLLAPIAIYPDAVVAQVLMASTYPLEIVQADRWAQANKDLKGDALTAALEDQPWDPSVKSLVNFPQVLSMMSEKLDWTTSLGDAFLAQQQDVMNSIQRLRGLAHAQGNLQTTPQQTVTVQQESGAEVIVVESSSTEVIYIPTYNPSIIYGPWPYPAYPPYYYYPPGYAATAGISFGLGFACGAAWGYAWGGCNWHHGDVDIDIDRNFQLNNRIDRGRYRSELGNRNRNLQNGRGSWQHDPTHRKGAAYRDSNTARKYGGASAGDAARTRESFRGRADAGRQDLARGGADQARRAQPAQTPRQPAGARPSRPPSAQRPQSAQRPPSAPQQRAPSAQPRRLTPNQPGGAFNGVGQGQQVRNESQRGHASRSAPSQGGGRSSASRGGAPRGGGGGGAMRGGGGGRGGGRR